jgi:hypothetical protein
VSALRAAAIASCASLAPFTCWLLFEARQTPLPLIAPTALSALVLVQSLALALWLPLLPASDVREHALGGVLSAIAPAPFGAILWLSGAVSAAALARGFIALVILALATSLLARAVARDAPFAMLTRACVQVALAALLWRLRDAWLGPLLA